MSIINDLTIVELKDLVEESNSYSDVMRKLDLAISGAAVKILKTRIAQELIDISHFKVSDGIRKKQSLSSILTVNSATSSRSLKNRLIKEGLLNNQCYQCGQLDIWNGKPLVLQLDHINGIHSDNRLENLQILCPNCHTQTETFGTRRHKVNRFCQFCGTKINNKSTRCKSCATTQTARRKVMNRPSHEELIQLLQEHSYIAVGKMFGVSDNSVRKWIHQYENTGRNAKSRATSLSS